MTDTELDTVYTALAQSLGRAGQEKTPLLLSTLCLALLAKQTDARAALDFIAQAENLM